MSRAGSVGRAGQQSIAKELLAMREGLCDVIVTEKSAASRTASLLLCARSVGPLLPLDSPEVEHLVVTRVHSRRGREAQP